MLYNNTTELYHIHHLWTALGTLWSGLGPSSMFVADPSRSGEAPSGLQEAIRVALEGTPTTEHHAAVQMRTQIQQNRNFALGWALEAVWDSLLATLGHSWGALQPPLGALRALRVSSLVISWHFWSALGTASALQTPLRTNFGRISSRLGVHWSRFGNGIWVFGQRFGMQNYMP